MPGQGASESQSEGRRERSGEVEREKREKREQREIRRVVLLSGRRGWERVALSRSSPPAAVLMLPARWTILTSSSSSFSSSCSSSSPSSHSLNPSLLVRSPLLRQPPLLFSFRCSKRLSVAIFVFFAPLYSNPLSLSRSLSFCPSVHAVCTFPRTFAVYRGTIRPS